MRAMTAAYATTGSPGDRLQRVPVAPVRPSGETSDEVVQQGAQLGIVLGSDREQSSSLVGETLQPP